MRIDASFPHDDPFARSLMADPEERRRALRRRVRAEERLLLVVAGPRGPDKSTFVETFLKPAGVNPDEVAKGLL